MNSFETTWANLHVREKNTFLCLAPFLSYFYYDYENIKEYLLPLRKYHKLGNDPHRGFYQVLHKGIEEGIVQKSDGPLAFMKLNPQFRFFLTKELKKLSLQVLRTDIGAAFLAYYDNYAASLYKMLKSGEPADYKLAMSVVELEYPNLVEVISGILQLNKNFLLFTSIVGKYFTWTNRQKEWIDFELKLKKQLEERPDGAHPSLVIAVLDSIGNLYVELHQMDNARRNFMEAHSLCEQLDTSDPAVARLKKTILGNLGLCAGTLAQQVHYLEQALELAHQMDDVHSIGSLAYNLSEIYFESHNHEKSREYLEIATKAFQEKGDPKTMVKLLQSFASHYQLEGELDKAGDSLVSALGIAQDLKEELLQGVLLQELASLHYQKKQFGTAKTYCKKAILEFVKSGDLRQEANAYNLLSVLNFEQGNVADGMNYAEKALSLFNEVDDWPQMAQTFTNIALKCFELQWYDECITELSKAMQLFEGIIDENGLSRSRLLLSSAFLETNALEDAQAQCLMALRYFLKTGDDRQISYCLNLGNAIAKESTDEAFKNELKHLSSGQFSD